MENERRYAAVRIVDIPYHVDKPYTYYIPPVGETGAEEEYRRGSFVMVPFGAGTNRRVIGVITDLLTEQELPRNLDRKKCKPIASPVSFEFYLNDELLGLCGYLSEQTYATFGDVAKAMLPAGALRRLFEQYVVNRSPDALALLEKKYRPGSPERDVYALVAKAGAIRRDRLRKRFGDPLADAAERLRVQQILLRETCLSDAENAQTKEFVRCEIPADAVIGLLSDNEEVRKRYHYRLKKGKHDALLAKLCEIDGEEISRADLLEDTRISWDSVRSLEKAGILSVRSELDYRNPYEALAKNPPKPHDDNVLSAAQNKVFSTLRGLYRSGEAKAALLHGVTGSGKTRVIKAMMDEVLADRKQIIMLVPEISLTPQSIAIFCSYYGDRVAVLHSGLSTGERLDVWRRARAHDIDIVIGTRSAIFTPFDRLGMIVIDEEQEHTYKSDQAPKYHARDAARYRCAANNALLLLASATPSFESYYKAEKGIYTLVSLTERFGGASLPKVVFADMHTDRVVTDETGAAADPIASAEGVQGHTGQQGGEVPLGKTLSDALLAVKENNEQAIVFINRRGYHKYISCLSCKEPVMCPHCSVPMTLHVSRRQTQALSRGQIAGVLSCHYCGTKLAPPEVCPACGSAHLYPFGYGTERAERELTERFPALRTLRMDADTTGGKFSHEEILSSFRAGEADVLLGTQMVTKGHDFPRVTLVGILSADALLYKEDYNASEQAFALLTQVIGRAGRASLPGTAVIQTYNPDNEVLRLAASQDFVTFYHKAICMREAMIFPPFCDLVVISFSSQEEAEVMAAATKFHSRLQALRAGDGEFSDVPLAVFGPFEASIYKLQDRYRMRIIIKCRHNKRARQLFTTLMKEFSALCSGMVTVGIDVNPSSI